MRFPALRVGYLIRLVFLVSAALLFSAPAPANAHLRFAGIGQNLEVSFDDGRTWQSAELQAQEKIKEDHFQSYWMPIPAGTNSMQFRGEKWWGGRWLVRDISIWASDDEAVTH